MTCNLSTANTGGRLKKRQTLHLSVIEAKAHEAAVQCECLLPSGDGIPFQAIIQVAEERGWRPQSDGVHGRFVKVHFLEAWWDT